MIATWIVLFLSLASAFPNRNQLPPPTTTTDCPETTHPPQRPPTGPPVPFLKKLLAKGLFSKEHRSWRNQHNATRNSWKGIQVGHRPSPSSGLLHKSKGKGHHHHSVIVVPVALVGGHHWGHIRHPTHQFIVLTGNNVITLPHHQHHGKKTLHGKKTSGNIIQLFLTTGNTGINVETGKKCHIEIETGIRKCHDIKDSHEGKVKEVLDEKLKLGLHELKDDILEVDHKLASKGTELVAEKEAELDLLKSVGGEILHKEEEKVAEVVGVIKAGEEEILQKEDEVIGVLKVGGEAILEKEETKIAEGLHELDILKYDLQQDDAELLGDLYILESDGGDLHKEDAETLDAASELKIAEAS